MKKQAGLLFGEFQLVDVAELLQLKNIQPNLGIKNDLAYQSCQFVLLCRTAD